MIDYSKTITKEEITKLSEQQYNFIKEEADKNIIVVKKKINWSPICKVDGLTRNKFTATSFNQVAKYVDNRTKYNNENKLVKIMIKANIVCPDSIKLFNILLDNNINYNTLLIIARGISDSKKLNELNNRLQQLLKNDISNRINVITNKNLRNNLDELLKSNITDEQLKLLRLIIEGINSQHKIQTMTNIQLNKIYSLMKKYYSVTESEIITARLMQIIVFEKELFKTLEKERKNQKTHR